MKIVLCVVGKTTTGYVKEGVEAVSYTHLRAHET